MSDARILRSQAGATRRAPIKRENCRDGRPRRHTQLRRVHHPSAPEVETDVPEAFEEEEVTRLQPRLGNASTFAVESVRAVWEIDPDSAIRPADEARAVEAARGRLAAPPVGNADNLQGDQRCTLTDGWDIGLSCGRGDACAPALRDPSLHESRVEALRSPPVNPFTVPSPV